MVIQDYINEQKWLEEWFRHTARAAALSGNKDKIRFKQEFDELIKVGLDNSKINFIDETALLIELADDTPIINNLKTIVRENYLKHTVIDYGRCNFFEFLKDNGIISFEEYSNAYKIAHTLEWRMEYNATMFKKILETLETRLNKGDVAAFTMPTELDTTEAKGLFKKAIEAGLMSETANGYKWDKTKALCAHFADRATEILNISKALTANEEKAANWKPFEETFGYTDLKGCKAKWRQTGQLPKYSDIVDSLFG